MNILIIGIIILIIYNIIKFSRKEKFTSEETSEIQGRFMNKYPNIVSYEPLACLNNKKIWAFGKCYGMEELKPICEQMVETKN